MFRYYQRSEHDAWFALPTPAGTDPVALAMANGAKKLTILTINQMVADGDDPEVPRNRDQLSYRGPLYFDIDCKEDIGLAIASGLELVTRLMAMGAPEAGLQVFLSGSKGVHVLVEEKLFSQGRFTRRLPEIYKEMARHLYVPGLDFAVYSGGRGNSFRIANLQRHDGNYRVPVTITELRAMTPELYRSLVTHPRTIEQDPLPAVQVPELMAIYESAKKAVNAKQKVVLIATSAELEKIKYDPPSCIQMICDAKNVKSDASFNQQATQLAAYIVRAGVDQNTADGLAARLADNGKSSKFTTVRQRREHIEAQVRYVEHTPGFSFGCNAIRALLSKRPCEACVIEAGDGEGDDEASGISAEVRADGFYVPYGDNYRRITNFTLQPHEVFIDVPQDGTAPRRMGTKMGVLRGGVEVARILFRESAFNSKSGFLKEIEGVLDLTFQGSDQDAQRIKTAIYKEGQDVGEVFQVYTCGVHVDFIGDTPIFTYVEPDMSINTVWVKGTHQFLGQLLARPYFSKTALPTKGDKEADHAVTSLLKMNRPLEMGLIIGWCAACHFKAHLMHLYNQFPVLSLYGSAGAGKSITAGTATWINGTDYLSQDSGVNAPSSTHYGVLDYVSNVTTIPRIIEEYNKSKMSPGAYKDVGERIKQAWGAETALRGKPGTRPMGRVNAESVAIPITAPLIVMSEQEIEMPAIQERSVRVHLTKAKRAGRREHYEVARRNRMMLRNFGKAMMAESLATTFEDIEKLMDRASDLLPEMMDDRPRYSMQVILLGLWKMKEVLVNLQFYQAVSTLETLLDAVLETVSSRQNDDEKFGYVQSEIDLVVNKIALLIAISKSAEESGSGHIYLRQGINYCVTPEYLILDPVLAHANYARYVSLEEKAPPVIANPKQFLKLIAEEPYYAGMKPHSNMGSGRDMLFLSLSGLENKLIDTSLVKGGEDGAWANFG